MNRSFLLILAVVVCSASSISGQAADYHPCLIVKPQRVVLNNPLAERSTGQLRYFAKAMQVCKKNAGLIEYRTRAGRQERVEDAVVIKQLRHILESDYGISPERLRFVRIGTRPVLEAVLYSLHTDPIQEVKPRRSK